MKLTEHFKLEEFLKHQVEEPSKDVLDNLKKIAYLLEYYRAAYFNNAPITITSGYRSKDYNKKIGGAINSYHVKGLAVDFRVKDFAPKQVQDLLDKAHFGGLEYAPTWTHIDIRGYNARFTP